ncbi:hypothetical protein FNJ88_06560 [Chryseobacterium sp. SNU WT5]|uniref:DUF7832 domain-containing protein n=1 Tax=Chryseobacterium sp. SNU WT5 TaxID=2594269 RepID=UPI00117EC2A3|nr:hypothetical protein [Chryseobacterium sp. SNU WT5]QDP85235.1 hypothetical protein FNJ88_06515 [Chryseobacterium sp. SNU WT5]QDP85244.1 hypothetical protein FNJ88_06560 [Chryseobacterium sp. SNU WT5]
MTYDRIDWHSSGDNFPRSLEFKNGGTHIGMFITWTIQNNLIGELHLQDSKESLEKVKNRKITGRDFLIKECDSKFWDEDLNEEGNKFAKYYYANQEYGDYILDYEKAFNNYNNLYQVDDTWSNYDKIKPIIDKRYKEWKATFSK